MSDPTIISILATLPFVIFGGLIIYFIIKAPSKGKVGEARVAKVLAQLPEEYLVLNDIVLNTEQGTSQIDHTVISRYGIFTIETKNYRGDIYGDDRRQQWTQIIVTEVWYRRGWHPYTYVKKSHFYNPVKQSIGHMYRIRELLNGYPNLPIIPMVVFIGDANIEKVNTQRIVIHEDQLLDAIQRYRTIYMQQEEVHHIYGLLQKNNIRDLVTDKQHAEAIRAKYHTH